MNFSTNNGILFLNRNGTNFQHSEVIRLINQKRITEDTFEDLEALNLIHGNIK